MKLTKHQIEYKGKKYGYWTDETGVSTGNIRSENGFKTPYLRTGSKMHTEVLAAIKVAQTVQS